MTELAFLLSSVLAIAVLAVFIGLGRIIGSRHPVAERIEALTRLPAIEDTDIQALPQQEQPNPIVGIIERTISRRPLASSLAAELAQANLPLTVGEYVLWRVVSVGLFFFITLIFSRQLVLAVLSAIAGFFLPKLYVQRKQAKRSTAFQRQLTDVLTLLVSAVRSGYGLTIALDTVAKQMPPPASEEFRRVVVEIGLGLSSTQALSNLVRRIRSEDLDLIVTAITIQHEAGGNLATILETISQTIRERIRLQEQLRVLTAQQRLQRTILTLMPFGLSAVIYLLNPTYLFALFTPGPTLIIPIAAAVLLALGYVVMGKLGQIEI